MLKDGDDRLDALHTNDELKISLPFSGKKNAAQFTT